MPDSNSVLEREVEEGVQSNVISGIRAREATTKTKDSLDKSERGLRERL